MLGTPLSPQTLTKHEQAAQLTVTAAHSRDHLKSRVRIRAEIAKGGRAADVFLPDSLIAKLKRFWEWKLEHQEPLDPDAPLFCNQGRRPKTKTTLPPLMHAP